VDDELVIRQVRPVPHGRLLISPFEASEDFTQACWQSNEAIINSPSDLFYSITRAGEEVVRLIVVDHPEVDTGYGITTPGTAQRQSIGAPEGNSHVQLVACASPGVRLPLRRGSLYEPVREGPSKQGGLL